MVELVPGYGVYLSKMQLDEVEEESNNSPTKLIRNLISVFFPRAQLARSSAYGTRRNVALPRDILLACISKLLWCIYQLQHKFSFPYDLIHTELSWSIYKINWPQLL